MSEELRILLLENIDLLDQIYSWCEFEEGQSYATPSILISESQFGKLEDLVNHIKTLYGYRLGE